jgi:hypothetical protein
MCIGLAGMQAQCAFNEILLSFYSKYSLVSKIFLNFAVNNQKKNYYMRKVIFILCLFLTNIISANAQTFSMAELDIYSGKGKKKDVTMAAEIARDNPLNSQYEFVKACIIECPGHPKIELYNKIYQWILGMSSNSQSAIQVADTIAGIIQTRLYISQIAKRTMGDNHYFVSIRPLLTFDFKDGKIRFTYSLESYYVLKKTDDSGVGFMMGNMFFYSGEGDKDNQVWPLISCYPFTKNPSFPKVTSSRALVNTVATYNILKDRITSALNTKKRDDNW